MSFWRHLTSGVRVLTNRKSAEADISDEVHHYFEQATHELEAGGVTPEEARRKVRLELGNTEVISEQVRAYGWENVFATLLSDLRYGARRLRASPGFTTVAVMTLGLGIGATTAIFSAINPILFEPLPYPHAEQIISIHDGADGSGNDITFGTYREVSDRSRSFSAVTVIKAWQPTMTGNAEPERLNGQRVSARFFRVLGVRPAIGRDFTAAEDQSNGARVTILSNRLWHRRFGADPSIIGRQIDLNGDQYQVVGIMPVGFENVLEPSAELWSTLQYDMSQGRAWGHHLRMIARTRNGIATEDAARELDLIARTPQPEFARVPWADLQSGFGVATVQDDITRGVRPALLAVFGAVILLLLISCVNVTNLLLGRGAQRRGEFALRTALGGGKTRLIRQLLTESLLLALIGGALGIAIAQLGIRTLVVLSPADLPRASAIRLDGTVLLFCLAVTTLIGVVFGLVPARYAIGEDLHTSLQQGSRRTIASHQVTRRALVVVEVALALVLLVGSGSLLRSLNHLFAVAPGFNSSQILTMQVQTAGHQFDDNVTTYRFFANALEAVRALPGVESAGFTAQLPLSGDYDVYGLRFESSTNIDPDGDGAAFRYAVTPGYVETMRIPLRRGRLLTEHDGVDAPHVVLINESLANRVFRKTDPIGRRLRLGPEDARLATIVGVVGDVKQTSLALTVPDEVYLPTTQWQFADRVLSLVVRIRGDASTAVPAIKQAIWSVDKDQPIVRIAMMDRLVVDSAAERRFALILFEAFGVAALLLAAIGIYGVLSGSVTERTREIGVRSALGASSNDILALIVRQGMSMTALGVIIGLIGAMAASRMLLTLLFGVSRLDPITYAGVIVLLAGVSAVACCAPALRAARVDPAITLRSE